MKRLVEPQDENPDAAPPPTMFRVVVSYDPRLGKKQETMTTESIDWAMDIFMKALDRGDIINVAIAAARMLNDNVPDNDYRMSGPSPPPRSKPATTTVDYTRPAYMNPPLPPPVKDQPPPPPPVVKRHKIERDYQSDLSHIQRLEQDLSTMYIEVSEKDAAMKRPNLDPNEMARLNEELISLSAEMAGNEILLLEFIEDHLFHFYGNPDRAETKEQNKGNTLFNELLSRRNQLKAKQEKMG